MENENRIRGAVFSKFPSIESFAKAIGWKRNKASRIVNGIQRPSVCDVEEMALTLDIVNAENFIHIFFPTLSTK